MNFAITVKDLTVINKNNQSDLEIKISSG